MSCQCPRTESDFDKLRLALRSKIEKGSDLTPAEITLRLVLERLERTTLERRAFQLAKEKLELRAADLMERLENCESEERSLREDRNTLCESLRERRLIVQVAEREKAHETAVQAVML